MESWMWWFLLCWHLLILYFSPTHSLCHPHDNFALLQFKNSFTNDTTGHFYGQCDDVYPKTTTWENGTDCCSWLGVSCHPISGHVIGLNIACNRLEGKINPNSTLFHLSHLQSLNLAFNHFSQSHLSSLFGGFPSLKHLNLASCYFEGEISSQISHLSKLASLDLSDNSLECKEDTWKRLLQNATVLRELVLDGTNMSSISMRTLNLSSSLVTLSLPVTSLRGKLTNEILCLPKLQHLDLSFCDFQGSIPPFFSNLTRLTFLDLSGNNLSGSIPSSLLTLPRLTFLQLKQNQLSGQIPNVFPVSNKFEELNLSENNLEGELPSTLSNLQHLIVLDLSQNIFSSHIPDVFVGLTKLSVLYLSSNKLRGPIPSSLFGLTQLSWLRLYGNLLNGTIPYWCLSLPSLVQLDLSENKFTGHINAISSYSLESIDLSYNNLQGNIPESMFILVNLTHLDLSSNNLSGPVNFPLFSRLQNLQRLYLSQNDQLSLNFRSNVNYSLNNLEFLNLSSMGLIEFPKLSRKVPNLKFLCLSNNKLDGRVPNWLLEMSSIYAIDLSHNLLMQSLDQFTWNYNLWYLDLSFNSLTGGISSLICNASSINVVNLSHNKLTGLIPQCLANLSRLVALDLRMNKLHGTLPSTFSNNCWLQTLDLNGNKLEGILPESLSNCTGLSVLDLGNNQIEDKFPSWLERLPGLKVLVLGANKFYGPIASLKTKHGFPSLVIFDISSNNFSGPIPKVYIKLFDAMKCQCDQISPYMLPVFEYAGGVYTDSVSVTTKAISMTMEKILIDFVSIDFSKNRFEGEIPDVIGELHLLKALNLSHNRLSGHIPQSMGNLTNLESLDLSSNMLTGNIPNKLTNLNFLEVLNLSNNHLVGEIPQGKQFNTFSNDSYEANSGLCGVPLTKECSNDPEQHSPPSMSLRKEEGFGFGWKPVAIGYGCGMVVGVGMGCCVLLIGKPRWIVRMVGGHPNTKVKRKTRMRANGNGRRMN